MLDEVLDYYGMTREDMVPTSRWTRARNEALERDRETEDRRRVTEAQPAEPSAFGPREPSRAADAVYSMDALKESAPLKDWQDSKSEQAKGKKPDEQGQSLLKQQSTCAQSKVQSGLQASESVSPQMIVVVHKREELESDELGDSSTSKIIPSNPPAAPASDHETPFPRNPHLRVDALHRASESPSPPEHDSVQKSPESPPKSVELSPPIDHPEVSHSDLPAPNSEIQPPVLAKDLPPAAPPPEAPDVSPKLEPPKYLLQASGTDSSNSQLLVLFATLAQLTALANVDTGAPSAKPILSPPSQEPPTLDVPGPSINESPSEPEIFEIPVPQLDQEPSLHDPTPPMLDGIPVSSETEVTTKSILGDQPTTKLILPSIQIPSIPAPDVQRIPLDTPTKPSPEVIPKTNAEVKVTPDATPKKGHSIPPAVTVLGAGVAGVAGALAGLALVVVPWLRWRKNKARARQDVKNGNLGARRLHARQWRPAGVTEM